jgi:phosphoribosylanthranilate isomerase
MKEIKIKICGMKYPENIVEVALLQPDYLGYIFYDKSPRYFQNSIPDLDKSIQKVGVFVNATFKEIEEKVRQYQLDLVQLHGEEGPEFCAEIEKYLVKVIKSFSIDKKFNFNNLEIYKNSCSYFLFDTKGTQYGGNGISFDWSLLENYSLTNPYFISGGIGLENINELIEFLKNDSAKNCYSIDLNSKFETQPGLKDTTTLKDFLKKINNHDFKI